MGGKASFRAVPAVAVRRLPVQGRAPILPSSHAQEVTIAYVLLNAGLGSEECALVKMQDAEGICKACQSCGACDIMQGSGGEHKGDKCDIGKQETQI